MAPTFVSNRVYYLDSDPALLVRLSLPDPSNDRQSGVILIAPAPHENMRFFWSQKLLSQRLAESGFHCWMFDYRGTGDSEGSLANVQLMDWLVDCQLALDHARTKFAIKQCTVIGLRLGGWLAIELSRLTPVNRLVLVDPVINGDRYVIELDKMHQQMLYENPDSPPYAAEQKHFEQRLGFSYPSQLHHDLEQIQLNFLASQCPKITTLISQTDRSLVDQLPEGSRTLEIKEDLGWNQPWKLRLQCFATELNKTILTIMENS